MAPAALASCAIFDEVDYPPNDWGGSAATILANGCPDVSGTYDTRPIDAYPAGLAISPTLNEILGPSGLREGELLNRSWPALPDATTATFSSSGDWLYVRFLNDAGGEAALSFKRKNWWGGSFEGSYALFQCPQLESGPALGFDGSRKPIFTVPYPISPADLSLVFLSKGQDGSLIVNFRTARVSLERSVIGSAAGWVGGVWWRYAPVAPNR